MFVTDSHMSQSGSLMEPSSIGHVKTRWLPGSKLTQPPLTTTTQCQCARMLLGRAAKHRCHSSSPRAEHHRSAIWSYLVCAMHKCDCGTLEDECWAASASLQRSSAPSLIRCRGAAKLPERRGALRFASNSDVGGCIETTFSPHDLRVHLERLLRPLQLVEHIP